MSGRGAIVNSGIHKDGGAEHGRVSAFFDRLFRDGEALLARRRYGEAAARFLDYTTDQPDNPWGHYMLGLSRWQMGEAVEAEASFVTALAIDPVHIKSLLSLARVLVADGRLDEAGARLEVARDYAPHLSRDVPLARAGASRPGRGRTGHRGVSPRHCPRR